jgi:hypothetical protein
MKLYNKAMSQTYNISPHIKKEYILKMITKWIRPLQGSKNSHNSIY